jgi:hypothetical protein
MFILSSHRRCLPIRMKPRKQCFTVSMAGTTKLLFFFLWFYSPIQALAASMKLSVSLQLLDLGQSVGLLGRVISSSQGLYLYTITKKRTHNTNTKHPCPERDSKPRSRRPRERRQFIPETARLPWPASVRASEDSSCLRPLGYRDWHYKAVSETKCLSD